MTSCVQHYVCMYVQMYIGIGMCICMYVKSIVQDEQSIKLLATTKGEQLVLAMQQPEV